MDHGIPSADQLRAVLTRLRHNDLQRLSAASGVPFGTLWKVRIGETPNPRIGTVRAFWPHALKISTQSPEDEAA